MNWLLCRWLRRTFRDEESEDDWNTVLKSWAVGLLLILLLMGVGAWSEANESRRLEGWEPNQELLRKLRDSK